MSSPISYRPPTTLGWVILDPHYLSWVQHPGGVQIRLYDVLSRGRGGDASGDVVHRRFVARHAAVLDEHGNRDLRNAVHEGEPGEPRVGLGVARARHAHIGRTGLAAYGDARDVGLA